MNSPLELVVEEKEVCSHDGVMVPLSIIYVKGISLMELILQLSKHMVLMGYQLNQPLIGICCYGLNTAELCYCSCSWWW